MQDPSNPRHEPHSDDAAAMNEIPTAPLIGESTGATFRSPLFPERIGPYKILGALGAGGMGEVFLGARDDSQFAARVAIKRVRRGADNEQVVARFKTERRILAALHHPAIARLLDGGVSEDGSPYLVMEYIEGQPIDTYCDGRRLNIEDRLRLFMQVCDAVHFAHQNLVIHRDLKPANILVTEKGDPKLLDFGIAKLVNPDLAIVEHAPTLTRFRLMTPEYASPEQVRQAPITTASDIYSLGVILFELLTGHRPYKLERNTQDELEKIICEQDPDRPSTALSRVEEVRTRTRTGEVTTRRITPDGVSHARDGRLDRLRRRLAGDLDNIVLMALRKEPQRRYRSAEDLARDIQRHLDGMPVAARPDTLGYRTAKFVRRNRPAVMGAGAVGAALVFGLVGTTSAMNSAQVQRDVAQDALGEAERQRALAEDRLDRIVALSAQMLTFFEEIASGADQLRTGYFLVENAIRNLDSLGPEVRDDPVLALQLADAYGKIGEIQGGNRGANFGRLDDALASFTQAKAIYAPHVASSVRATIGSAGMSMKIADVHRRKGDPGLALRGYEDAIGIARDASRREPSNADATRTLAASLQSAGDAMWDAGRRVDALRAYRESITLRERLLAKEPDDARNTRMMAIAIGRVGRAERASGDFAQALDSLQRSRELRLTLRSNAKANDLRSERDLFLIELETARTYAELGDLRASRDLLLAARETVRANVASNPDDARSKLDFALVLHELAQSQADLGDLVASRDAYADAITAARSFREHSPDDMRGVRVEIGARRDLGRAFAEIGNADAAASHLDAAEQLLRDSQGRLEAPYAAQALGYIAESRGVAFASQGRRPESAEMFARAIAHYNALPAEIREADVRIRFSIGDAHRRRAELLIDTDPPTARREADLAVVIFESLGGFARSSRIDAACLAIDARQRQGDMSSEDAAAQIAQAIGDTIDPPPSALQRLGKARFDAGQKSDALEAVDLAIRLLDAKPMEGWERAALRRAIGEDRDRYSASP